MDQQRAQLLLSGTTRNRHWVSTTLSVALAAMVVFCVSTSSAGAATLNLDGGGQVVSASGVVVGGNLYDVEFLEGTCIALYSGCDDVSDFTFSTQADATLASQALLDQVFLDIGLGNFDSDVDLTFGCTGSTPHCDAITPFAVGAAIVTFATATNEEVAADLVLASDTLARTSNVLFTDNVVYAVWSPIPEPGTGILMGLGLLALSGRRRRTF